LRPARFQPRQVWHFRALGSTYDEPPPAPPPSAALTSRTTLSERTARARLSVSTAAAAAHKHDASRTKREILIAAPDFRRDRSAALGADFEQSRSCAFVAQISHDTFFALRSLPLKPILSEILHESALG